MKIVWGRSIGWNIDYNKACTRYNSTSLFDPWPGKNYMETTIITNGAGCYPWTETFIMWPRKTITGKRLFWTKAYKRRVWVVWGTGFHMEPAIQYATLFDMLL